MQDQPSLAPPRARVERAAQLLPELRDLLRDFLKSRPARIVALESSNPRDRRFRIESIASPPLDLRVRIGEVTHHLRASLDLLVFQLLLREGVEDEKVRRRSTFPILSYDLTVTSQRKLYNDAIDKAIGRLAEDIKARIIAIQPCNVSTDSPYKLLALLQELDNTSKHRLPLTAASCTRFPKVTSYDNGVARTFIDASVPVIEGMEAEVIDVPPEHQNFVPNLTNEVMFSEPGQGFGCPVYATLKRMGRLVRDTVDSFGDCLQA